MEAKFSVIIPTIWKSKYTIELLNRYSNSDYISEIILIDNSPKNAPDLSGIKKLNRIQEKENTFVNPAWNKGVELAKLDYIIISNDDILFDVDEFCGYLTYIDNSVINLKNAGYIGMHSDNYKIDKSESPVLENYENNTNKGGWGCLFALHKSNWVPIPERLKIWFGDNYIHAISKSVLQLRGMKVETNMSTSSDLEEVEDVKNRDVLEWHNLLSGK